MDKVIPRVAAIHDLSGFGRCSLTVIIPVLSAMGVQVCPLPTAILSTHSGGFGNFSFYDFTEHMKTYANHWSSLDLMFDCIYSGFLGSSSQVDEVLDLFRLFKRNKDQMIVVDPVMGDHGKPYKTYTPEMQQKMRFLVEKADIITPNLTEACILLNEPYRDEPMSRLQMKRLLRSLSELGPDAVILTSVRAEDGQFVNIGYGRSLDTYWTVPYEHVPAQYPGTGDIFTSVFVGSLLQGNTLPQAMERATRFVTMAVRTTYDAGTPVREGVVLERVLGDLIMSDQRS